MKNVPRGTLQEEMKMEKIIGFRRQSGVYEGKPYDNFYFVTTMTSRKYYGVTANETKVKTMIVLNALDDFRDNNGGANVTSADFIEEHPQVILGLQVEYFYNRFGQVTDIQLYEPQN